MVHTAEPISNTVSELADLARRQVVSSPAWLTERRRAAIDCFARVGFPTMRDEDWRFTNVDPIATSRFRLAGESGAAPTAAQLEPFDLEDAPGAGGARGPTLVFVNGRFAPGLSTVGSLPDGVRIAPLAEAIDHGDAIEQHLGRLAACDTDGFAALNTAFMTEGVFVHVPGGTAVEGLIRILNVATATDEPVMAHPRNLIICEADSRVAVAEQYVSLTDGAYLNNAVTEIEAGENAVVDHYLVEEESLRAFNISTLAIHQGRGSNVASHTVLLGGALVRNNVHPVLDGEGCDCLINGLFIGSGRQHLDNFMRVEHTQPRCDSRQFYKGILDDRAHGVFSGRIYVAREAQKTDAKQTSANLLLSDEAKIDTKPQLEIYADDVKCTHGATIGQLDEDAVFYLRSRGIHGDAARAIVINAFAAESLERMKLESVRRVLERKLLAKLARG